MKCTGKLIGAPGRLLLWIIFCCELGLQAGVPSAPATAPPVNYGSRTWQADEGLPDNSVQAVLQTHDGYLWVGTRKGLARFDGVGFKTFAPEAIPALKNPVVTSLAEDANGTLWIGTAGGGLTKLNEGRFQHVDLPGNARANNVRTLFRSSDGSLWIGTLNGAFRYQSSAFTAYCIANAGHENVVRAISEYHNQIWVGAGFGITVLKDGAVTNQLMPPEISNVSVRALQVDARSNLWVAFSGGLYRFNGQHWQHFGKQDGLADHNVSALLEDRRGDMWIGTFGGLNRLAGNKMLTEKDSTGNFFDQVNSLIQDQEGNIWVGASDGLHQLRIRRFTTITRQQRLPHNNVLSIIEDPAGGFWVGTWGSGLAHLNSKGVADFIPPHGAEEGRSADFVLGLCVTKDGSLYYGTDYDGGVFRYKDGELQHYWKYGEGLLPEQVFRAIYEDHATNLWFGSGSGLLLWNTREKFLPGSIIRCILEDHSDRLWVGTLNGLFCRENGKFTSYTTTNGLSDNRISAFYEDPQHDLWIATAEGLNRLHDAHFTKFTTRDGLWNDDIFAILEDKHGWLWMSCPKGIFRVDKKSLCAGMENHEPITSVVYGKADGMVSVHCNGVAQPSACKSHDGRLWFATAKGLAVVTPDFDSDRNTRPPPVFIEEVVSEKSVYPVNHGSTSKTGDALSAQVRIPPGHGDLEVRYTALSFDVPERNRFQYRLDGVDPEWKDAGTRRFAVYSNLRPGKYQFHVKACNNDGVWNEAGDLAEIVILPHFWQAVWFIPAVALSVGVLLWGAYRSRQNHLRAIERIRLRMASDLHDEVGSNLGSISLISRLMQDQRTTLSEDDRRDLTLIHRLAGETANSVKDIVWFTNPGYDTIADLLSRMEDESRTLLAGMDCQFHAQVDNPLQKLPLDFRQNLFLLFKEALANIIKHARARRVEIQVAEKEGAWRLEISDDGVGFDPGRNYRGNGLKNLRRRAATLDGALEIESVPGRGTTLLFASTKPIRY